MPLISKDKAVLTMLHVVFFIFKNVNSLNPSGGFLAFRKIGTPTSAVDYESVFFIPNQMLPFKPLTGDKLPVSLFLFFGRFQ
jgi:hypothetical protein